jgi:hypothetical protein
MNTRNFRIVSAIFLAALIVGCGKGEQGTEKLSGGQSIEGAWRSQIHFTSGAFASATGLEFMYVFNDGGTYTESSNYDAAPPVPPAYGVWRSLGGDTFEAKSEYYATRVPDTSEHMPAGSGWLPAGRGIIHETITLAKDGKTYTSHITYQMYDQSGAEGADHGEGTAEGVRIGF